MLEPFAMSFVVGRSPERRRAADRRLAIRRVSYTTDAIESVNIVLRNSMDAAPPNRRLDRCAA